MKTLISAQPLFHSARWPDMLAGRPPLAKVSAGALSLGVPA